jgi:hypothetical protein
LWYFYSGVRSKVLTINEKNILFIRGSLGLSHVVRYLVISDELRRLIEKWKLLTGFTPAGDLLARNAAAMIQKLLRRGKSIFRLETTRHRHSRFHQS